MSDEEAGADADFRPKSELDIGRVLTEGWSAFRSRLKDFLVVAIGFGLVYGIIAGLIVLIFFGASKTTTPGDASGAVMGLAIGGILVTLILLMLTGIVVAAIETRLALAAVDGDDSILGHLGREALSRIGPFFGWGLLASLLVVVGLILCILPGIAAAFFMMFLPYIVIEGRLKGNPIVESFNGVKERIGELVITYLVLVGISLIGNLVIFVFQRVPILGTVIRGVVSFVIAGFAVCTYAVVYRSTSLGALATSEPQIPDAEILPPPDAPDADEE